MKFRLSMLIGVVMASSMPAHADDYGCTVLLCLANPAGPMAVAECVPSIKKLYRDLARGRAFPTCQMANASDAPGGKSWAEHGVSYYDPCPAGTTALEAGAYATRSTDSSTYYRGIGDGDTPNNDDTGSLRDKICVGNQIGDAAIDTGDGDGSTPLSVGVFDQVVVVSPSPQPNYIDVYVNSTFLHRVRW